MSAVRQQIGDDAYVTTGIVIAYDSFSPRPSSDRRGRRGGESRMAPPNLPDAEQALVDRVDHAYRRAEPEHKTLPPRRPSSFYGALPRLLGLHARGASKRATCDEVIYARRKKTWGAELFIPFVLLDDRDDRAADGRAPARA